MAARAPRAVSEIFTTILRYKAGVAGLAIVLFYVVLGVIGPMVTKYDPVAAVGIADNVALPEWYAQIVDPKLPRNMELYFSSWRVVSESREGDVRVNVMSDGGRLVILFSGTGASNVSIESTDLYPY
ncbi:MAG: hypothetical protein QXP18_04770, partial [Sulfolobales archaeon]